MPAPRFLLVPLVVTGALAVSLAAQSSQPAADAIKELIKAWDEAYMARDLVAVQRVIADDYVLTDASGAKLSKQEYLMSIVKAPDISRVKSWTSEKLDVRVAANTATVTGESSVKGRARGRGSVVDARYRFTETWARRNGRWVAVSTTATRISK